MPEETEEERFTRTRHLISDWLMAEGWKLRELTDQAGGAAWGLEGTDPRNKVVVFSQSRKRPDALVMQAMINVDEASRARLEGLGSAKNEALGWEIRFQLLNMGLKFVGLTLPLERFGLVMRVYTDDLGRNGFFERVDRLQDGILAAIWLIRRALDEPAPESNGADGVEVN